MQKNDGFLYLAGLTSWAWGCAQPNLPTIFTRVPAYARALKAVMDGQASTLTGESDATAVLESSGTTDNPDTGNGTETEGTTGGGSGGGGGGGALSIACLGLAWLRRRPLKNASIG